MLYGKTRLMAEDIRKMIDLHISQKTSYDELKQYLRELLDNEEKRNKVFRAKGLSATIETVLGKDRLIIFKKVLTDLGFHI